jgi:hypothetical protein
MVSMRPEASEQPVKPQVFALDAKTLQENKKRVKAKDPQIMGSYKQLLKDADNALEFGPVSVMEKKNTPPSGNKHDYMSLAPYWWPDPTKPDGLPYIRKDGQTNPEVKEYKDKEYQPKLCESIFVLALAWYFSEEKVYADHAATLVRVWFLDTATRMNPNLNFAQAVRGVNTGRGAGLIDTRHYVKLIDAIGLLRDSKFWRSEDQKGMEQWFAAFLDWMQTSPIGKDEMDAQNNHGTWYDAQRLAMALFIGDKVQAKNIVLSTRDRIDKQMDNDGKFPKEMERTMSLHYTVFVMNAFFVIAQMAEVLDMDLWKYTSPSGKSLQIGFEALRPYLIQEKKWEGQQIKEYEQEEGFPLLMVGALQYNCKKCPDAIRSLAADKTDRLRIHLLY